MNWGPQRIDDLENPTMMSSKSTIPLKWKPFLITARIWRMPGGYVFKGVCLQLSWGGGGCPLPSSWWGVSLSGWQGGTPSCQKGVSPSGWWGLPYPSQQGGTGNPIFPDGDTLGYPLSIKTGWGSPPPIKMGVLSHQDWMKQPPPPLRRQSSRASTCYAVGGKRLAFTPGDFLFFSKIQVTSVLLQQSEQFNFPTRV